MGVGVDTYIIVLHYTTLQSTTLHYTALHYTLSMASPSSIEELNHLLISTPSPSPLLRPRFWRMKPRNFCSALATQFRCSRDEVFPGVWLGNKWAAENIEFLLER